jgi:photosynthetic reaction center H subunit
MDIVGRIDFAQITLYAFWIFFAGLVVYLRREDKREGYPLESPQGPVTGWPVTPGPKVFVSREDGERTTSRGGDA